MSQATDQYNAAVRRYEIAEQRISELEAALRKIIDMNVRYAIDKYGDASKAESMSCVSTARTALKGLK